MLYSCFLRSLQTFRALNFIGKRKEKALSYSLRLFSKQWPNHVTDNLSLHRFNAYKHVLSVHYLFADGHAVRVGCYDAFAKKLQLVGKGNLWPGNRVRENLNFIWAYSFGQLQPAFSDFFTNDKRDKSLFPSPLQIYSNTFSTQSKYQMRLGKSSIVYPFPNKETREKLGTGWEVFDQECLFLCWSLGFITFFKSSKWNSNS